jgi:hypothetical protein
VGRQRTDDISRNTPEWVKLQLRQEVGLGCPIADCHEPFLSWHHFDPPWCKEQHHRPEGMIALCKRHHEMADRGLFEDFQLREYKTAGLTAELVKARFEWSRLKQIVRLGGFYATARGTVELYNRGFCPLLTFNENDQGFLELSFALQDQSGQTLAEMRSNMFQAVPPQLFDIAVDTGGTKIQIRVSRSDVVLDIRTKRFTIEELTELLHADWARWIRFRDRSSESNPNFRTHQEIHKPIGPALVSSRILGGQPDRTSPVSILPTEAESTEYRDSTINDVLAHANYLKGADEYVYVLNVQNLVTYQSGVKWEVRDGFCQTNPSGAFAGWGFGCVMLK